MGSYSILLELVCFNSNVEWWLNLFLLWSFIFYDSATRSL